MSQEPEQVKDLSKFQKLEEILLKGRLTKEYEVEDGLKVELQTLTHGEYLEIINEMRGIEPIDQMDYIKCPTLARAVISINGKTWSEKLGTSNIKSIKEEILSWKQAVVSTLYNKFLDLVASYNKEEQHLKNS